MTESANKSKLYRAEVLGSELLELEINAQGSEKLRLVASQATINLVKSLMSHSQKVADWIPPAGNNTSAILVRELIAKVRGEFVFPLTDPELCHCRAVPAAKVDQAIISGAHRVEKIRRMTSANTACGTCLPEIEKLLKFRLTG